MALEESVSTNGKGDLVRETIDEVVLRLSQPV